MPNGWVLKPAVEGRTASLAAVALSLVVGGLLIVIAGGEPVAAYGALLDGAFGNAYAVGQMLAGRRCRS